MKHITTLLALLVFVPAIVWADTPPVPPKKQNIGALNQKLDQHKAEKQSLEKQRHSIEKELNSTRDQLVKLSRSTQENEASLIDLEKRIAELEKQRTTIENALLQDRQSISRLVLALERIRRVPPEALIVKPGAPLKTAQSAMLMQDILPSLHKQAETLKKNLVDLESIQNDLNDKHEEALKRSQALKKEYDNLAGLVSKKEELYNQVDSDLKQEAENVKQISAQAKNLKDLVKKLEEERTRNQARVAQQAVYKNTPPPSPGAGRLPISGVIRIGYNQPDNFGAPSQGLTIEGRANALVVAPMGGTVRFAGYFKNHGNMVIIEHRNDYHSLIAGLEKIDTVVGHNISAGEPLGKLSRGIDGQNPTLYYELRQKGQPVNPGTKFPIQG